MVVLKSCPTMFTLADWVESRISSWRYFSFGTEDMKLQLDDQQRVVVMTLPSQLQKAEPPVDVRVHIDGRHLDCPHCEYCLHGTAVLKPLVVTNVANFHTPVTNMQVHYCCFNLAPGLCY